MRERVLEMNGFRELGKDLFIRPNNLNETVSNLRDRLYGQGLKPEASVFEIHHLDAERDNRAHRLWDSDAIVRKYQATRQQPTE